MDAIILNFIYVFAAISSILGIIFSILAFNNNNTDEGFALLFLTVFGLFGAIGGLIIGGFIGLIYVSIQECMKKRNNYVNALTPD